MKIFNLRLMAVSSVLLFSSLPGFAQSNGDGTFRVRAVYSNGYEIHQSQGSINNSSSQAIINWQIRKANEALRRESQADADKMRRNSAESIRKIQLKIKQLKKHNLYLDRQIEANLLSLSRGLNGFADRFNSRIPIRGVNAGTVQLELKNIRLALDNQSLIHVAHEIYLIQAAQAEETLNGELDLSKEREYINNVLDRYLTTSDGIIDTFPLARPPVVAFKTSPLSDSGVRLRNSLNVTLSTQQIVATHCSSALQMKAKCNSIASSYDELKYLHIAADSLFANGATQPGNLLLSSLSAIGTNLGKRTLGFISGAGKATVRQVEELIDGVYEILTNPKAMINGLASGIMNCGQTLKVLKNLAGAQIDRILSDDPIESGEALGELAIEIGSFLLGPAIIKTIPKLAKGLILTRASKMSANIERLARSTKLKLPAQLSSRAVIHSALKLGLKSKEGIQNFVDLSKRVLGGKITAASDLYKVIKGKIIYYSPIKKGPLSYILTASGTVADTFRSRSYFKTISNRATKLYRVYGNGKKDPLFSKYWSRVKPSGPMQSILDSALDPAWGNTAKHWVEITVPKGTRFFEGVVSGIALKTGRLLGGGSQVYIKRRKIPKRWLTGKGKF